MHTLLTALATHTGVVTGVLTGTFALSGVVLTQWFNARQQARARRREDNNKIEAAVAELVSAVIDLQTALAARQPRWNAWTPRLRTMGMAVLEFAAGNAAAGYAHGAAQSARVVMDWHNRSSDAAETVLRLPGARFFTAVSRAALLPDRDIADAVVHVATAAIDAMSAAAVDNLYQRRAAEARRAETEQALQVALGTLIRVTRGRLHPPAQARWRRMLGRRQMRPTVVTAAADQLTTGPPSRPRTSD